MKTSIIVPTRNEATFLPHLLESLERQTFKDFEIIVADAASTDRTREVAEAHGAMVVTGGMPGPGRNAGARHAKGEILFFLDADVVLPPDFLETAVAEMEERFVDLATCEFRPLSDYSLDRAIHHFMNATIRASARFDPHAMGFAIFVTKRLFERVGGFDETIKVGEDSEFVKRAAKLRGLQFLERPYLSVSVRRFEKEGRLQCAKTGIRLNLYRAFKGEVREDEIEYKFEEYGQRKEFDKKSILDQVERSLMSLEDRIRERTRKHSLSDHDRRITAQLVEEARQQLKSIFLTSRKRGSPAS